MQEKRESMCTDPRFHRFLVVLASGPKRLSTIVAEFGARLVLRLALRTGDALQVRAAFRAETGVGRDRGLAARAALRGRLLLSLALGLALLVAAEGVADRAGHCRAHAHAGTEAKALASTAGVV